MPRALFTLVAAAAASAPGLLLADPHAVFRFAMRGVSESSWRDNGRFRLLIDGVICERVYVNIHTHTRGGPLEVISPRARLFFFLLALALSVNNDYLFLSFYFIISFFF